MNALYVRAEALERDLERARAELAELRGERPAPLRARDDGAFPAGELRAPAPRDEPPPPPPPAFDRVLDALDERARPAEPPALSALHDYEDAIARAVELLMAELVARHRRIDGDGTHEQLLWVLDLLVAHWR